MSWIPSLPQFLKMAEDSNSSQNSNSVSKAVAPSSTKSSSKKRSTDPNEADLTRESKKKRTEPQVERDTSSEKKKKKKSSKDKDKKDKDKHKSKSKHILDDSTVSQHDQSKGSDEADNKEKRKKKRKSKHTESSQQDSIQENLHPGIIAASSNLNPSPSNLSAEASEAKGKKKKGNESQQTSSQVEQPNDKADADNQHTKSQPDRQIASPAKKGKRQKTKEGPSQSESQPAVGSASTHESAAILANSQAQSSDRENKQAQPSSTLAAIVSVSTAQNDAKPATKKKSRAKKQPVKTESTLDAKASVARPAYRDFGNKKEEKRSKMIEELRNTPHREILVDRAYSSDILKALEREIGLVYKKGRFSSEETQIIQQGIQKFKDMNKMSDDDFRDLLYDFRARKWEKQHKDLWKELTSLLDGRANTSVRLHVKTHLSEFRKKGKYSAAEDQELRRCLGELKLDIATVGKRLGRLGQDVSSRWVKLQVHDELANEPPFTPEEDDEIVQIVEGYKQEHPGECVSWKEIALRLGNKRSHKVYYTSLPYIETRIRRRKNPKLSSIENEEDGDNKGQDIAEPEAGMWESHDGLILLQRMRFQDVNNVSQIKWEDISFSRWNWPVEKLREEFDQLKKEHLPAKWKNGWKPTINKLLTAVHKKQENATEQSEDELDEEEDGVAVVIPQEMIQEHLD